MPLDLMKIVSSASSKLENGIALHGFPGQIFCN